MLNFMPLVYDKYRRVRYSFIYNEMIISSFILQSENLHSFPDLFILVFTV